MALRAKSINVKLIIPDQLLRPGYTFACIFGLICVLISFAFTSMYAAKWNTICEQIHSSH